MSDLLLILNALRDAVRPKRLLIALLLILLPPILGGVWRMVAPMEVFDPGDVYDSITMFLVFSFTMPILAVVYGTGVVSQELEGRTIIYLLIRPYPRWRILLSKFLVCLLVIFTITALSIVALALVLFGPTHFAEAGVSKDIPALFMGTLTYSSLFLLLGAAIPKPLTFGLIFVFGWETLVPKLPGQFVRTSIMTYLRVLSQRELTADTTNTDGNILLSFTAPPQIEIPMSQAWLILGIITAVCLIGALIIFSVREYAPREDSE